MSLEPLDPLAPNLPLLGRGRFGSFDWAIGAYGPNLRMGFAEGDEMTEVDIALPAEREQLYRFVKALESALEGLP